MDQEILEAINKALVAASNADGSIIRSEIDGDELVVTIGVGSDAGLQLYSARLSVTEWQPEIV